MDASYVGCYDLSSDSQNIPQPFEVVYSSHTSSAITLTNCSSACAGANWGLFALNYDACACGSLLPGSGDSVADSLCTSPCPGETTLSSCPPATSSSSSASELWSVHYSNYTVPALAVPTASSSPTTHTAAQTWIIPVVVVAAVLSISILTALGWWFMKRRHRQARTREARMVVGRSATWDMEKDWVVRAKADADHRRVVDTRDRDAQWVAAEAMMRRRREDDEEEIAVLGDPAPSSRAGHFNMSTHAVCSDPALPPVPVDSESARLPPRPVSWLQRTLPTRRSSADAAAVVGGPNGPAKPVPVRRVKTSFGIGNDDPPRRSAQFVRPHMGSLAEPGYWMHAHRAVQSDEGHYPSLIRHHPMSLEHLPPGSPNGNPMLYFSTSPGTSSHGHGAVASSLGHGGAFASSSMGHATTGTAHTSTDGPISRSDSTSSAMWLLHPMRTRRDSEPTVEEVGHALEEDVPQLPMSGRPHDYGYGYGYAYGYALDEAREEGEAAGEDYVVPGEPENTLPTRKLSVHVAPAIASEPRHPVYNSQPLRSFMRVPEESPATIATSSAGLGIGLPQSPPPAVSVSSRMGAEGSPQWRSRLNSCGSFGTQYVLDDGIRLSLTNPDSINTRSVDSLATSRLPSSSAGRSDVSPRLASPSMSRQMASAAPRSTSLAPSLGRAKPIIAGCTGGVDPLSPPTSPDGGGLVH